MNQIIVLEINSKGFSRDGARKLQSFFEAIGYSETLAEKISGNTISILKKCKKLKEAGERVENYFYKSDIGEHLKLNSYNIKIIEEEGQWYLKIIKGIFDGNQERI